MNNQSKNNQSKIGRNLIILGIGLIIFVSLVGNGVWRKINEQCMINSEQNIANEQREGLKIRLFNNFGDIIREIIWNAREPEKVIVFNAGEKTIKENEQLIKVFKENSEELDFEKIDTSSWKTYRNDHYGYQISYPEDWEIYVSDNRDPGGHTSDSMTLHITKECDLKKLKKKNTPCSNVVEITSRKPTSMPSCGRDRVKSGQLPKTALKAFRDVFTLKEGESRESLKYNKQSSCFIYDGVPRCSYSFTNSPIYFTGDTCYSIEIKDSTKERKYLKTEEAIIESLKVIKKLN